MRVLLDTNVFLRLTTEPQTVPQRYREAIDAAESRYLSMASAWEMAVKVSIGKLPLPMRVADYVSTRLKDLQTRVLAIELPHIDCLQGLPVHHRDPFDRLIVAQALSEDLTVITTDEKFAAYGVTLLES